MRPKALPEARCPDLALETSIAPINTDCLTLTGEFRAEKPLDTRYAYL